MSKPSVAVLIAILVAGSCADQGSDGDPLETATAAGLPDGYALRLDRQNREPGSFVVDVNAGAFDVRTGPAGIVYRPDERVDSGSYAVSASLTEVDAPIGHLEGFGLFVGGEDLDAADRQRYSYFLVRGDGSFLIRVRDGSATRDISNGWQRTDSIRLAQSPGGDVSNDLAISVDGEEVQFWCNGVQVARAPLEVMPVYGAAGFRVNHNLHVLIEDFRVER